MKNEQVKKNPKKSDAELFQRGYIRLCKKYGYRIVAVLSYEQIAGGKFVTKVQTQIVKQVQENG